MGKDKLNSSSGLLRAWFLHFHSGPLVFASTHGGADCVGGSRPEDRDEHHPPSATLKSPSINPEFQT